jgi:hypothetical protein
VDFDEGRLAAHSDGSRNWFWRIHDVAPTLLSWSAIEQSLHNTREPQQPDTLRSGFLPCDPDSSGSSVGHIEESAKGFFDSLSTRSYLDRGGNEQWRTELRELVRVLGESGADVTVVVPPFHGSMYVGMMRSDYLDPYLEMIRAIAKDAAAYRNIRVVDFTGPTSYHFEASTDRLLISRYWDDANHFSCALGDLMVETMLSGQSREQYFGATITAHNVDAHVETLRASFRRWLADDPRAATYSAWYDMAT